MAPRVLNFAAGRMLEASVGSSALPLNYAVRANNNEQTKYELWGLATDHFIGNAGKIGHLAQGDFFV